MFSSPTQMILGAPNVYSSFYQDFSSYSYSSREIGSITCRTRYSPPTIVTWQRDGVTVDVDGDRYQMTQTVTDRRNSYYDNILLVHNAADLVGNHTFTCSISNYAGSTFASTNTTMRGYYSKEYFSIHMWHITFFLTVAPTVGITSSGESILGVPHMLTCSASLNYRISPQLTKYLVVEWIGPDGLPVTEENRITVEEQHTSTRLLNFHSLNAADGGLYQCVAKLVIPNAGVTYNSRAEYNLIVKSECMSALTNKGIHNTSSFL